MNKVNNLILKQFKNIINNFNIKNLNINVFSNFKIKIKKNIFLLSEICEIQKIEEKKFNFIFKDEKIFKEIKNKIFFENYGFIVIKKKISLEITIPNLSIEYRNKVLNIIKEEFSFYKNKIENYRKKFLILNKEKYSSIDDVIRNEKLINNNFIKLKTNIKNIYEDFIYKNLNE
ncbi:putative ribosome recycling factor [Candidatus Carsonella ruddii CS isolate Thao2000]|uniref:Putative ribosome recycling factor n=1 Tax=Candidatus Carsonella ruddii CS isolate Thao2000 TaxID=1202537 RepID=J7H069_CARRU|nr:ribosome recycling factor [Candidatus Carsonella ruddii]AFP83685.1 putative ribosome recycling factor [Candidatus Carsonella ruddii CS isolate Thao2000]